MKHLLSIIFIILTLPHSTHASKTSLKDLLDAEEMEIAAVEQQAAQAKATALAFETQAQKAKGQKQLIAQQLLEKAAAEKALEESHATNIGLLNCALSMLREEKSKKERNIAQRRLSIDKLDTEIAGLIKLLQAQPQITYTTIATKPLLQLTEPEAMTKEPARPKLTTLRKTRGDAAPVTKG